MTATAPVRDVTTQSLDRGVRRGERLDVAKRALRLIGDGLVDREGVGGLARRLGYSERQLHRILVAELGASPIALARAHRAHAARQLLEDSSLTHVQVARAAGFGSVRQFNETVREAFGVSPSALRRDSRGDRKLPTNTVRLRLATREPFDGDAVVRFLKRHEVPGLERVRDGAYTRALGLDRGEGIVTLTPQRDGVLCDIRLEDLRDLVAAVARCRRLFDLDADPRAIYDGLARCSAVGELVRAAPGVRMPGTVDGFELTVRTILREGNLQEAARKAAAALITRHGPALRMDDASVTHNFPTAEILAEADPATFGTDAVRARAISVLAQNVVAGDIRLDAGATVGESMSNLLAVPGIGPWIASYVAIRFLGDRDAFLVGCRRVEHALARLGVPHHSEEMAELVNQWRPWRSYAVAHLWRSLDDQDDAPLSDNPAPTMHDACPDSVVESATGHPDSNVKNSAPKRTSQ